MSAAGLRFETEFIEISQKLINQMKTDKNQSPNRLYLPTENLATVKVLRHFVTLASFFNIINQFSQIAF